MAMLRELATAAGSRGMCGGQALDIDATGAVSPLHVEELERLHALKNGALLRASVRMGAIAAGVDADTPESLDRSDRKGVVVGKSGVGRLGLGGGRHSKKKKT